MLWETQLETALRVIKTEAPDGRGGVQTRLTAGDSLQIAFSFDESAERTNAEKATAVPEYILTTYKDVALKYHDIVIRARDNKAFRVTSNGDDNTSPITSGLNMRQVKAELFKLEETYNYG